MRAPPLELIVELARSVEAADPFAFQFAEQAYLFRHEDGSFETGVFPWSEAVLEDLASLERARPDRAAAQRLGDRLSAFLAQASWKTDQARISQTLAEGRHVYITIRSAAAELYALPWELITIKSTGQHLGELPGCLLRYEWPGAKVAPRAVEPPPVGGRVLFAWSAAGGAVPAAEHLAALSKACKDGYHPFNEDRDVLANTSLASLKEALSNAAAPVSVLHILAHGGAADSDTQSYGLVLNGSSPDGAPEVIDAGSLRQLLAPHAGDLRLVVLCACHGGGSGALGNHLGSLAQALHRVGIPAVVASRYPFSVEGSTALTEALYRSLLVDLASLEDAFLAARAKLGERPNHLDWAAIQLYCGPLPGERADHRPFVFRPYPGLSAFQASDRRFYFGREGDVKRLLKVLGGGRRLVALVGASGSGKSSLVMAGLVPAILKGALGDGAWWVRSMHPGAQPGSILKGLARTLVAKDDDGAPRSMHVGASHALPSLRTARKDNFASSAMMSLAAAKGSPRLLLVVDQFEEVFTQSADKTEASRFIDDLLDAAEEPAGKIVVVVTLRADFLDQSLEHRRLAERVRESMDIALPMSIPMIREAIVRPAELAGLRFEDGLVEALIDALREGESGSEHEGAEGALSPGSLPLLQFALEELWEHRRGNVISWSAWRDIKGIRGAIAKRADDVLAELKSPEERAMVRDLFSRLIRLGDGTADTRRYATRDELEAMFPGKAGLILDRLIAARLLIINESEVGIAHEALIREWGELRRWLGEGREALRARQDLDEDAHRWEQGEKSEDDLWRGGRLRRAVELSAAYHLPLSPLERAFLDASEAHERRAAEALEAQRKRELLAAQKLAESEKYAARRLKFVIGLMGVVLVVSVAALYKTIEFRRAEEEVKQKTALVEQEGARAKAAGEKATAEARVARDATRIAAAHDLLETDPTRAALVLREVEKIDAAAGWVDVACELLWKPVSHRILRHGAALTAAAWSPDGRRVLTASEDQTARIWATSGAPISLPHDSPVTFAAWSPDGGRVVTITRGGEARVWRADASGTPLVIQRAGNLTSAAWSRDSKQILTVARDHKVRVLRADGRGSPVELAHDSGVTSAVFSPDGARVLTGAADGVARLWPSDGAGAPVLLKGHKSSVVSAAFDGDGKRVVTASTDRTARIWSADGKGAAIELKGHEGALLSATFSPDGKLVVTTAEDKLGRIFQAEGGRLLALLKGHEGRPMSASWSPDGSRILTVSDGQTPRVWRTNGDGRSILLKGHAGTTVAASWSPDGKWVLTASNDSTARIWDVADIDDAADMKHLSAVCSAAFSPDGQSVVTVLEDGTARIWAPGSAAPVALFHKGSIQSAIFSPESARVLTTSDDAIARIWPVSGGAPVALKGHTKRITSAAFSPDGARVLTTSDDATARLWPASGGTSVVLKHDASVASGSFSPDGARIVTAGADKKARIWPVDGGAPVELPHASELASASFNLDGTKVLTACKDGSVRVWNADGSGAPAVLADSGRAVLYAAWGPKGQHLLAVGDDNTVRVWPESTSPRPLSFVGTSAVFSPDAARVLTTPRSDPDTARLYSIDERREPIALKGHEGAINSVVFSPDGDRALTASEDHTAKIWLLSPKLLMSALNQLTAACLSADDRRKLLGEDPDLAAATASRCADAPAPSAPAAEPSHP